MYTTGNKRAAACLISTVLISVSLLHGAEVVVCIAEDGHVSLERALNGQCIPAPCPTEKAADPPIARVAISNSGAHCGTCSDVPIVASLALLSSREENTLKNPFNQGGKSSLFHLSGLSSISENLGTLACSFPVSPPLLISPARSGVLRN